MSDLENLRDEVRLEEEVAELQMRLNRALLDAKDFPENQLTDFEWKVELISFAGSRAYDQYRELFDQ